MDRHKLLLVVSTMFVLLLAGSCGLGDSGDETLTIDISFETSNWWNGYRYWGSGSVAASRSGGTGRINGGSGPSSGETRENILWSVQVVYFDSNSDHKIIISGHEDNSVMITGSSCSATGFGDVYIVCSSFKR